MSKQNRIPANNSSLGTSDGEDQATVDTFKQASGAIDNAIQDIEGTPFKSVRTGEGQYTVTFGKWAISSKQFHSHKEAARYINAYDWQLILNVIGIMTEHQISETTKKEG